MLKNAGVNVAKAGHEAVWETLGSLEQHPRIGRQRRDLRDYGIRSWRVNRFTRWLILYRVEANRIVIYRVRSGTMNLTVLKIRG